MSYILPALLLALLSMKTPLQDLDAAEFDWTGYLSIVYSKSDNSASTSDGVDKSHSLGEATKLGLISYGYLSEGLESQVKLSAKGSSHDQFSVRFDRVQLTYRPQNNYALHVGLQKNPVWLISDHIDIGALYPWVRPPIEVYELNPLSNFLGVRGEARYTLSPQWRLEASVRGGIMPIQVGSEQTLLVRTTEESKLTGVEASLLSDWLNFRLSYVFAIFDAETVIKQDISDSDTGITTRQHIVSDLSLGKTQEFAAGVHLDWNNIENYTEIVGLFTESDGFDRSLAWYTTTGYWFGERSFFPHFTFSQLVESGSSLKPGTQQSYTLGGKYRINSVFTLKGEWQYVNVSDAPSPRFREDPGEDVQILAFSIDAVF